MTRLGAAGLLLLAPTLVASPAQDAIADIAKRLKDKDVVIRLVAVDELARERDPKAEKALHGAFGDGDWEVVERAAAALEKNGTTVSIDPLVKLALEAPVARIRRTAARSLGRISARESAKRLQRKLTGPDALLVAEALATALASAPKDELASDPVDLATIEKTALRGKDATLQAAAARALVAGSPADRPRVLQKLLASKSVQVRCAALDACAADESASLDAARVSVLAPPERSDLVGRRARAHLEGALFGRAGGGDAAARSLSVIAPRHASQAGDVCARGARILASFGEAAPPAEGKVARPDPGPATGTGATAPGEGSVPEAGSVAAKAPRFDPTALLAALEPALAHADEGARAAATRALARIGGPEATRRALAIGAGDRSARVRFQAVDAVSSLRGIEEDAVAFLTDRLANDPSADVRVEAAVKLGVRGDVFGVDALVRALADPAWEVGGSAAVSLG
jgi:HEAT repeat protein